MTEKKTPCGWCPCCKIGFEDDCAPYAELVIQGTQEAAQDFRADRQGTMLPPPGSWAETARMMAQAFPDDDFDWDRWKDEMKEGDL